MEITVTLIAVIGTLVSLVASLLTNLIASKTFISKSKIKIGGVEFQLSGSADESTRRILDKVQELQESPQVFISYSFKDKEFAQHLATDLRKQGIKVWLADEQVKVGDRIIDTIREGISSSQWTIVLLSENSLKSDYTSKELLFALDEEHTRNRPFILPAVISDTELPIQLQDKQYADFRENYNLGLEKILARVKPSATRAYIQNQSRINDQITEAFLLLKEKANSLPDESVRHDVQAIIDKLEIEVRKSDKANEQNLGRLLRNLIRMSPDIGEVALSTMANPIQAISVVSRKIAERIKAENSSDE